MAERRDVFLELARLGEFLLRVKLVQLAHELRRYAETVRVETEIVVAA